MKKPRIIHIYDRDPNSWFPPEGTDEWFLAGWSGTIARQTAGSTDCYEIDSWRADPTIATVETRRVSGVTCRVFPARTRRDLKIGPPEMWDCLEEARAQGPVVVHHSGIHHPRFYWLLRRFGDLPVIGQSHGEPRPFVWYNRRPALRQVAQLFVEAALFPRAAGLLYLREAEARYLGTVAPRVRRTFVTVGTEFDRPCFDGLSRREAKARLGLDPAVPLALYIGRFFRLKSVEQILAARRKLAGSRDLAFCLVGGSKEDDLFGQVAASGATWRPFLPHDEVLLYHRAADVYLSPFLVYGGFDVAVMEALSFGVPVVSRLLSELPAKDRDQLGAEVTTARGLVPAILDVLDHPEGFPRCRSVARRWFGWESIAARLGQLYRGCLDRAGPGTKG